MRSIVCVCCVCACAVPCRPPALPLRKQCAVLYLRDRLTFGQEFESPTERHLSNGIITLICSRRLLLVSCTNAQPSQTLRISCYSGRNIEGACHEGLKGARVFSMDTPITWFENVLMSGSPCDCLARKAFTFQRSTKISYGC